MKITKRKIVRASRKKDELSQEIKSLNREISKLTKRVRAKEELFIQADRVSDVIRGEPLMIWGSKRCRHLESLDPENKRAAHIYLNAHNNKTFGLRINEYWAKGNNHRWHGDKLCGTKWESYKAAEEAALAWIIDGTLPKENGTGEVVKEDLF